MVRRLIQRFLHWLRHTLAQVRGKKSRHHHQPLTQKLPQLPPSFHEQLFDDRMLAQQPSSPSQYPKQPSRDRVSLQPFPQEHQSPPPNPAANRAPNPSNFKVLLSGYEYSPSSAIQNLSQQLSHPAPQSDSNAPASKTSKPSPNTEQNKIRQGEIHFIKTNTIEKKTEHIFHGGEKSALNFSPTDSKAWSKHEIASLEIKQSVSPILGDSASRLSTEQIPKPTEHTPRPIPTTSAADPRVITKQGVVKLLFKLKKNNHHGYIAPHDGSKDIIFHKKYIGDDVFRQLERGMAVEVTAHVTEGKAYADHIRIL